MAATSSDKVLVAAAAALVVASAAVFGAMAWRYAHAARAPIPQAELSDRDYTPVAVQAAALKADTWNLPGPQSRGREWLYDTFTPPEIFYSARSRQFTVKPPFGMGEGEPEEEFGLELVSVRPEPFRLQLIGYVGGDGHWRGTFENVLTGEVFLAAAGRQVTALGLSIRSLEVQPQPVALPDSMTTRQRIATAVVRDDKTGREVTLTHRERQFTGSVAAFVARPGETATREVRAGDVFKLGEATYRIDKVQLAPPSLEVTKEAPTLAQPDRRALVPREADPPEKPGGGGGP
jgi:hypothetical protein